MGFMDRFKRHAEAVEVNPWEEAPAVAPVVQAVANPWKPPKPPKLQRVDESAWAAPGRGVKVRVLHHASSVLILLNICVGLFFYSSNQTLNAALLGYLGVSTILLGHYWSLTR